MKDTLFVLSVMFNNVLSILVLFCEFCNKYYWHYNYLDIIKNTDCGMKVKKRKKDLFKNQCAL